MTQGGKYDVAGLIEAQFEPGSDKRVLRNLLGIRRKREMDQAEGDALEAAVIESMGTYDEGHRFTSLDIRHMHNVWLGGIYGWAGEYRQVNVGKGGFLFAAAGQIPQLMTELEKGPLRRHTPCNFRTRDRVIEALAEVHTELLLIHPFREGNGRLARLFANLMVSQAGLPFLDFHFLKGKAKEHYFSAVRAGLDRDYRPMQDIFRIALEKALRTSGR